MRCDAKVCVLCMSVCSCIYTDALISAAPVVCNCVRAHTDVRICGRAPTHRHIGGTKWCMISRVPMLHVSAVPLSQRPKTVAPSAWGGTPVCGRAAGTGAPCLCGSACAHPSEPPRGHMCAHACAARWVGVQKMRPSEVVVSHAFRMDYFVCPTVFFPLPWLCGCMRSEGNSGHPLAAPTPASPRSIKATIHPFIYSNINIFAFRRQTKRDNALPRVLFIPPV